ncbi:MAG: putative crispr-associated protein, family [Osedax symbiont Rs1]|nr:MAG: putative crispr-associated protein, family [Osedax symbiont Rs1]
MNNILLAITGASPQVVTETLFALHVEGKAFPDVLYVITTLGFKKMLMQGLFEDGHLAALQDEYQMPVLKFDESHIWLIEDENGQPIDDAKSIADQTYMADFITRKVFELTEQADTTIHASIAGGRKTMAFYLGYAMSLLGRPQDTLSHVFVNDDFEFVRDFYYPTKQTNWIEGKKDYQGQSTQIDTSTAQVTLAEIPFVRMRQSVDPQLIESMRTYSFSQSVAALNSMHNGALTLQLSIKGKSLSIAGVDIKLTGKEFAFYHWLLSLSQGSENGLIVDRYFEEKSEYSVQFLQFFAQVSTDTRVFEGSFNITPEDFKAENYSNLKSMERSFVQQCCSAINNKLSKALPKNISQKIAVNSTAVASNQHYKITAIAQGVSVKAVT